MSSDEKLLQLIDWLNGEKFIIVDEHSTTMSGEFEQEHKWELATNITINKVIKKVQEMLNPPLYWYGGEWIEVIPDITEDIKTIYRLDLDKDGHQTIMEIDCSRVVSDMYGGDVEKFKKNLKNIKVEGFGIPTTFILGENKYYPIPHIYRENVTYHRILSDGSKAFYYDRNHALICMVDRVKEG